MIFTVVSPIDLIHLLLRNLVVASSESVSSHPVVHTIDCQVLDFQRDCALFNRLLVLAWRWSPLLLLLKLSSC